MMYVLYIVDEIYDMIFYSILFFNTRKSKTFNLGIKALENMNRAYYTLKLKLLLDNGRFLSGPLMHAQVPYA
jgi:hypothetical protein